MICSGPRRDKQFTYALLDERAPATKPKTREEALAELAKRYFASHGPATARDFCVVVGTDRARTRSMAIDSVRPSLESASIGGLTLWSAEDPADAAPKGAVAMLLPNYDEYLIAYKDRDAFVDKARAANIVARTGGAFANHLMIDGRLAGGWSRTLKPNARADRGRAVQEADAGADPRRCKRGRVLRRIPRLTPRHCRLCKPPIH